MADDILGNMKKKIPAFPFGKVRTAYDAADVREEKKRKKTRMKKSNCYCYSSVFSNPSSLVLVSLLSLQLREYRLPMVQE